ncbi:hypothetical protein BDK51DRAFT_47789 [Blyttiomyces helicus]|uniref:Uncharacterized protein n=1 Tax=Blyttiomyces helicus TaxID=388810 RepID=A0A4P9W1T0_9FUNG|nr:hypothetical protein BDK51DRAFT_47789 [Blyttiomyces helicus]|eukprot:RKO85642.1 hypothetical protein BDK51DRAFT_47789 [Blyttiomyces helicus]
MAVASILTFESGIYPLRLTTISDPTSSCISTGRSAWRSRSEREVNGRCESVIQGATQALNLKYLILTSCTALLVHTPALKSVVLLAELENFEELFLSLLEACPPLDELDICGNRINSSKFDLLRRHRPLELFRAEEMEVDVTAATILQYLSLRGGRLRRLVLPRRTWEPHAWEPGVHVWEDGAGDAIAAALVPHVPRLVTLDFTRWPQPSRHLDGASAVRLEEAHEGGAVESGGGETDVDAGA